MSKKISVHISCLEWTGHQFFERLHTNFISLFFLLFFSIANAETILCPENKKIDQLIDQATSLNSNGKSKEALKLFQKANDLAKAVECEKGELNATKNIMLIYSEAYDYKKALEISNRARVLALSQEDYKTLSTLCNKRAILFENLGIYGESLKEYEAALKYAILIAEPDQRYYQTSLVYYNMAPYYQGQSDKKVLYYLEKSKEEILKISDTSKEVPLDKKADMLVSINMNLGIHFRDSKNKGRNVKLSEFYFIQALKQLHLIKKEINLETKIDLYQALQELYQMKKDYRKAIQYGENMLAMERSSSMPYNRRVGYMVLAKSYLGIGDNSTSQKYLDLFSKLNDSINSVEKQAVEDPVKKVISDTKINGEKKITRIAAISFGTLILMTGGMLIYRRRSHKIIHKKYEDLIGKILNDNEINKIEQSSDRHNKNNGIKTAITITDETVKVLLVKLEKFETSKKYLRKDLSLTWMANSLATNPKYLSEIIKTYKNHNFTSYINELRINYIIKKLYENPIYREYKITSLAEECGYGTPRVFVNAFKQQTGFTPSYFVEQLKISV
ncbi:YesN/AraC family two-component response regulator [Chryseobacterium sp. H1D6B]|uniref:helix-turn-helix transcriptional regulator n=1 Tax=Chryseobacterium sp. H1D6B TaxID=2940588 RepID=UPI0015C89514|nr:helix-turn-helix transcriptional regulator [Chryseobacterium sp. H1D6B]MDH6253415.1 YesN/AraC family two-component response regulator [Chryseobacterium sp. H1D6B]